MELALSIYCLLGCLSIAREDNILNWLFIKLKRNGIFWGQSTLGSQNWFLLVSKSWKQLKWLLNWYNRVSIEANNNKSECNSLRRPIGKHRNPKLSSLQWSLQKQAFTNCFCNVDVLIAFPTDILHIMMPLYMETLPLSLSLNTFCKVLQPNIQSF